GTAQRALAKLIVAVVMTTQGGGASTARRSPRARLRSATSSRPASGDSGVVSGSGGSLSHRHQQQPPPPQSDLELLADSERQICRLLTNKNPASRSSLNLSYRRLTILPPSLARLGQDLRRLYLNNNRLVAPPSEIGDLLPELQELTLDHNCLSLLPSSLGQLEHLRILSASYNPLCAVPDTLCKLAGLTHLWLHACQLSGLPDQLFAGMPNLKQLGLNYNRLNSLPESIGRCTCLEWLSAEENQLTELPDSLANCQRLNLVNLTANRFVEVPPPLLPLLASCLRHLLLRANPLSPDCLSDELLMQIMAPGADGAAAGDAEEPLSSRAPRIDLRGATELMALPAHWKGISNILVGPEDSDETANEAN
ncbi:hypothetical protein BOX15_Mlig011970g2, partial [Macrostomum lignano]